MSNATNSPGQTIKAPETDDVDAIIIDRWPTTSLTITPEMHAVLHPNNPDSFLVQNTHGACSGTWSDHITFALEILTADNTHRVTKACESVPQWVAINPERLPDGLTASTGGKDNTAYDKAPNPPEPRYGFQTGGIRVVNNSESRFGDQYKILATDGGVSWWEMMKYAVRILSNPLTEQAIEDTVSFPSLTTDDGDLPLLASLSDDHVESVYIDPGKYDTDAVSGTKPYRVRKGVPGNPNADSVSDLQ